MPRADHPSLRELRAVAELLDHCRQVGADPDAWRRRLAQGVLDLVGGRVCLTGEIEHAWDENSRGLQLVEVGWESADQRQSFHAYLLKGGYLADPTNRLLQPLRAPVVCVSRYQLMTRRQWHAQPIFRDHYAISGLEDSLLCLTDLPNDRTSIIALHGQLGAPPFNTRQRRLLRYLALRLQPLIGSALADALDPVNRLTLRQRETLRLLLQGHSERDAATALGVSHGTLHKYVTQLLRHFAVNSRAQLQARFIGRGELAEPAQDLVKAFATRRYRVGKPLG